MCVSGIIATENSGSPGLPGQWFKYPQILPLPVTTPLSLSSQPLSSSADLTGTGTAAEKSGEWKCESGGNGGWVFLCPC